jgi:uncharacterized protein YggE
MDDGSSQQGEATGKERPGERVKRRRGRRAVVVLVGVALMGGGVALGEGLLPSAGAATSSPPPPTGGQITVTGEGRVNGTPDTASFQIGVHTVAPSATLALSTNDAKMRALMAALGKKGVRRSDMQTSSLDVSPDYGSVGNLTGFSADDELQVTVHDIAIAGPAIDAAAASVGDGIEIYGISFSISNSSGLLAAARSAAMRNAREEASQLAAGAGDRLGSIVSVTDHENAPPPVVTPIFGAVAASDALPVAPGEQPVDVQVSVTYRLRS